MRNLKGGGSHARGDEGDGVLKPRDDDVLDSVDTPIRRPDNLVQDRECRLQASVSGRVKQCQPVRLPPSSVVNTTLNVPAETQARQASRRP